MGVTPPQPSGFIVDYPLIEPIQGMEGGWGWDKPDVQYQHYDKIFLDSIEIWLAPDSPYKGIDADQMKILADTMRAVMVETLEPEYPVVSQPGPGVIRIRLALTNVHLEKKKRHLIGYTPIGLAVTAKCPKKCRGR